jgi:hypothetical protein
MASSYQIRPKSATNNQTNTNQRKPMQNALSMSYAFLPENYSAPKGENSNYMRLQDGENKFRILSQPILGWLDWDDKTPVRSIFNDKPKPLDSARPVKHFWAFIVWNYAIEAIQILEVTQASIRDAIAALCQDVDWGQPYFYDIKVTRRGKEKETSYTLSPMPHRPTAQKVKEAFAAKPCQLDKLFAGEDPWNDIQTPTPGIFDEKDLTVTLQKEQKTQLDQLMEVVADGGLTITHVQQFVKERAAEKSTPESEVIAGALVKDLTKYFLKAYGKWLKDTGKDTQDEVPF